MTDNLHALVVDLQARLTDAQDALERLRADLAAANARRSAEIELRHAAEEAQRAMAERVEALTKERDEANARLERIATRSRALCEAGACPHDHFYFSGSRCPVCVYEEIAVARGEKALDAERLAHAATQAKLDALLAPARIDEREFAGDPVVAWRAYHAERDAHAAARERLDAAEKQIYAERDAHGAVVRDAYRDLWKAATGEDDTGGCHTAYVEGLTRWRAKREADLAATQEQAAAREAVLVEALKPLEAMAFALDNRYGKPPAPDTEVVSIGTWGEPLPGFPVDFQAAIKITAADCRRAGALCDSLPAAAGRVLAVVEAAKAWQALREVPGRFEKNSPAWCDLENAALALNAAVRALTAEANAATTSTKESNPHA